jgi:hypothetical protein
MKATTAQSVPPAGVPERYRATREGRAFRMHLAVPSLFFLGTIAWLIGAAMGTAAFPRSLDENAGRGVQTGSGVAYIVASCLWLLGSMVAIGAAHAEAAALVVGGRVPGIARVAILSAWCVWPPPAAAAAGALQGAGGGDGGTRAYGDASPYPVTPPHVSPARTHPRRRRCRLELLASILLLIGAAIYTAASGVNVGPVTAAG